MAQRVKKQTAKSKSPQPTVAASSNDNLLWMMGFVLLIVGVISFFSVLSHFFHWASDLSALRNDEELSGVVVPFENICSSMGAHIANWFVDCSFGVFGIIIPIFIVVIGWRIFRKKALHLNHFALSAALLLVMGALTLGYAGSRLGVGYDIGGRFGHACATDLTAIIGNFGMIVLLLAGWVITGVFINRNFIHIVNDFSDNMVHQSEKIVSAVKDSVSKSRVEEVEEDEEEHISSEQPVQEPTMVTVPPTPEGAPMQSTPSQATPSQSIPPQNNNHSYSSATPSVAMDADNSPAENQIPSATTRPITINERYSNGYNVATKPEEEDEFYIEGQDDVTSEEPVQPAEPQFDEDGFLVVPSAGATLNKINVDALLSTQDVVATAPNNPASSEPQYDADGFAIVSRGDETVAQEASSNAVEGQLPPPNKNKYDFATPAASNKPYSTMEEQEIEDEDGLVITVRESAPKQRRESEIDNTLYDPLRDLESYKKPYVSLLEDYKSPHKVSDAEIYDNKCRIQETLKYFGIPIIDINATVGPTVTLYEIVQAQGVKISKIQGLERDIAQSLKALGIRIIAPIPGRGTIGIEVPNRDKQIVSMYSSICSEEFQSSKAELPVVIGRTIQNENYTFDLAKMPHLLVAGATGMGKSVGLNAIVTSLLYRKHPSELKFVMIDPKMVEFSIYAKLERHFLAKMESEDEAIVTDSKKAVYVLNSLVEEMSRRLELCKLAGVRNIVEYNAKFVARNLNPQKGHRFLPYIVVIIDEYADLIMTAKEVEVPVMRLAQKARAVGIHLIVATQRPDVKVITGNIKANFPARIAFRVQQMIDSRTILDQPGANQLIGRGDMLFSNNGELTRIQCALVDTPEVTRLVDYIAKQQGYTEAYPLPDYVPESGEGGGGAMSDGESSAPIKYDSLFGEIARDAVTNGTISTSAIQRTYEVGFNRAGRIMLQLERAGIVGPQMGSKPREIKFYDLPSLEAKLQDLGVF